MQKSPSLKIRRIEEKEKKGRHGKWRREYCDSYLEVLCRIQQCTQKQIDRDAVEQCKSVSCRQGCVHCCYHYVTASVAQGMVIVDYLYKNKALLQTFIDNYNIWLHAGGALSSGIDDTRNQGMRASLPMAQIIASTRSLADTYVSNAIPCPFLVENRCAIYEVRPLSCSGHFATSEPELCAVGPKREPEIYNITADDEDLADIIRISEPPMILYELALPTMVYQLLTEGSGVMISAAR